MNGVRKVHGQALAGIRPEQVELVEAAQLEGGAAPPDSLIGAVERCVFLGSITRVTLRVDGQPITVELQGRRDDLAPGTKLAVRLPQDALLPLDDPSP